MKNEYEKLNFRQEKNIDNYNKEKSSLNFDDIPFDLSSEAEQSDFIMVEFRALSETMVGANGYKASDFSQPNVIKSSVSKLIGRPVYLNHDLYSVEQAIGVIENAYYQEVTFDAEGKKIPAGINATLKIDAKANPKIARALLNDKPFIYSSSVTVGFNWVRSHQNSDGEYNYFGDIGSDGKLCCRIATEILEYYEISLVWSGSDPFAKMIKNNVPYLPNWSSVIDDNFYPSIINIPISSSTASSNFSKEEFNQTDVSQILAEISKLKDSFKNQDNQHQQEISKLKENNKVISGQLELKEIIIQNFEKEKIAMTSNFEKIQSDYQSLEQLFQKTSESLNNIWTERRDECKRLYLLSSNNNPSNVILNMIEKAENEELLALAQSYGKDLTILLHPICNCGKNVELRSSFADGDVNTKKNNFSETKTNKELSKSSFFRSNKNK